MCERRFSFTTVSGRRRTFCSTSLRGATREVAADRLDYIYVGMSTAVAFTLFGYILGRQTDQLAELSETDPLTGLFAPDGGANAVCWLCSPASAWGDDDSSSQIAGFRRKAGLHDY
jgi:hypothetical protein